MYLLIKEIDNKEEIFIKFIDKYYYYNDEKLEKVKISLNDIKEFYIIYSELPLALNL